MVIFIRHLNSFQCNMITLMFIDINFKYTDEYNTSITHDVRTPFHCVKDISYITFHCTVIILGVIVKRVF